MPRMPRLDLPGQFYHVIVRGNERRSIFCTDLDRTDFLKRFASGLADTGAQCFAWALMTNHLHLLILNGVRGLAALMHPLLTGYAGAFNRRRKRVGHLFQNRYKATLCEAETYFLELVRYIHLNPVRAGIVKTLADLARYPWTGHSALMGRAPRMWQAIDEVLGRFGSMAGPARQVYENFLNDGWSQGHRDDLEGGGLIRSLGGRSAALSTQRSGERQAYDARILGSGDFVERILAASEQAERQRGAVLRSGWSLKDLERLAAELTGVEPEFLRSADRRHPVARARALFVYAATEWLGRSSREMAGLFGCSSGSIVTTQRCTRLLTAGASREVTFSREIASNDPTLCFELLRRSRRRSFSLKRRRWP